jgi:hypothetical protein
MLSLLSLLLVVLSAAKIPRSKVVTTATEISEICQTYIKGDNDNRSTIYQLRYEIGKKFEGDNEAIIRDLTIGTINEIENSSYNTLNANDLVVLKKIASDILNDSFTLLMQILYQKKFRTIVFFLSLFNADSKLTVYPPMLTSQSKGVSQNKDEDGMMDKALNEAEFCRLADASKEFLKTLIPKRCSKEDMDLSTMLVRKLENEMVKFINARRSGNPQ